MVKISILLKRLISSIVFIICTSTTCYSHIIEGSLKGSKLEFRNLTKSFSGYDTVASWMPTKNLLPATKWSPGFQYKDIKVILVSPNGKTKVDISDAISVVGMEYKTSKDLKTSSRFLSGNICNRGSSVGNTTNAIDGKGTPCHGETYESNGKMPFYFMRPLLNIDFTKIKDAFSLIPDAQKQEGIYSFSTSLVTPYFFEIQNNVETWQNITSNLNISINYQPGVITNIRLKDSSEHDIKFLNNKDGDMIEGTTTFTVIADGTMPQGLILTVPKTNNFFLTHTDPDVEHPKMPITVECPQCSDNIIAEKGIAKIEDTIVNMSGSHIEFPIMVKVKEKKNNVSMGDYRGNFVLNFGLNL
ncbi:hypothetical protein ACRTC3_14450 [Photobacterium damselae]|uniref:hypothetical protein n=1 Tax=Photobacterium damselae TaxID=38293 RepID=UPI003D7E5477